MENIGVKYVFALRPVRHDALTNDPADPTHGADDQQIEDVGLSHFANHSRLAACRSRLRHEAGYASKFLPLEKVRKSGANAITALAVTGPTLGTVHRRRIP